jgi:hypothetical protein
MTQARSDRAEILRPGPLSVPVSITDLRLDGQDRAAWRTARPQSVAGTASGPGRQLARGGGGSARDPEQLCDARSARAGQPGTGLRVLLRHGRRCCDHRRRVAAEPGQGSWVSGSLAVKAFTVSPLPRPSGRGSGPAARIRRRQRQPDAPHCERYDHGDVDDEADACAPPVAPVSSPRWAADSGASPAGYTRIRKLAIHFQNSGSVLMMAASWTFLTSHARVPLCIAHDPGGAAARHRGQRRHHRA